MRGGKMKRWSCIGCRNRIEEVVQMRVIVPRYLAQSEYQQLPCSGIVAKGCPLGYSCLILPHH